MSTLTLSPVTAAPPLHTVTSKRPVNKKRQLAPTPALISLISNSQQAAKGIYRPDILPFMASPAKMGRVSSESAGWTELQGKITLFNESMLLGINCELYDAETFAALAALKAAMFSPITHLSDRIIICFDNLTVAARLLHTTTGSSQATSAEFND
ncbi:uncharacterized protein EAE98_005708 [Botrytis deweyae]|uniref:RNase H type-1 domain-containing protein n=1 Tax=Botrytis deweyae TaxID=2478750 RepID=A0ABQ7IMI8_9HELO|nr:uncharacterized protein EAE98_005708 [Botrytis deweyae]KAF7928652.1 hypothetical protein EAE98_005708 [Botrytis deweyae]